MLIKKYIKITIQDGTASVDDNLYFYRNDKNIDVMFELINFKFDFIKNQAVGENAIVKTNASYATLRIIKPNGEKLLVVRCPIEDYYVKFTVTPEFIDELEEVGIHQLQITLYDEFEGRISIPPISFEVLEPLFDDDEDWYEDGQVNITQANIVNIADNEEWVNDLNGRQEILEGTNLYEWKHKDWISDIRLNAIHNNIVRLSNMQSNQIGYGNNGLNTVQDALDTLLAPSLVINSFNISVNTLMEIGITVNWCDFTWSYNKNNIISQRINDIELGEGVIEYRYKTPFNTNKTFTLVANDGRDEKTKSITVQFCNRVFYGVSLIPEVYDSTFLNTLNSALQTSRNKTIQVNPLTNQYIYYSIPTKYGECVFSVNGFIGGFEKVATISHTNSYGYKEDYVIYKSDNQNLGNTTVVIQ